MNRATSAFAEDFSPWEVCPFPKRHCAGRGLFQGIDGPDERAMDRQVVKEEEGEGLNGSCENCEASSMTGQ